MAAKSRLDKHQSWRENIATSMILKRLNNQALDKIEMSDKALAASKILLSKTLPDLKQIDLDVGGTVKHEVILEW